MNMYEIKRVVTVDVSPLMQHCIKWFIGTCSRMFNGIKYMNCGKERMSQSFFFLEVQFATKLNGLCIWLLPIGYLYRFGVSIQKEVNHKINSNKSRRESKIKGITASEHMNLKKKCI